MNKKFLSVALFGALLVASAGTFTSCKDYDDDINGLQEQIDANNKTLDEKLTSLQAAMGKANADITSAQAAATAAQAAADKAQATGDAAAVAAAQAAQAAAAASQAAAQAKKDAIDEATRLVNELRTVVNGKVDKATYDEKMKIVDDHLDVIDGRLNDLEDADIAIKQQITVLENFKKEIDKLKLTTAFPELQTQVATLITDLNTLKGRVDKNETDIATLKEDLKKLSDRVGALEIRMSNVEGDVKNIGDKLNTLVALLSQRLTALTFAPSEFINGIEVINFATLKYKPWTVLLADASDGTAELSINDGKTTAVYYASPSSVKKANIKSLSILTNDATNSTRATAEEIITVTLNEEIENGKMVVNLKKNTTDSFDKPNTGNTENFTLLALRADIELTADETAKGMKPTVISDWARLAETSEVPLIHNVTYLTDIAEDLNDANKVPHFYPYTTIHDGVVSTTGGKFILQNVVYTESLDLNTLVGICDGKNHFYVAENYNLGFEFNLVDYRLVVNGVETNQKQFATITNGVITSKAIDGTTNNQDAIGREPLVQIILRDKANNNVVDVRYLKIQWVAKAENEDLGKADFTNVFDYNKCNQLYTNTVKNEFMTGVYTQLGIDKAAFHRLYALENKVYATAEDAIAGTPAATTLGTISATAPDYNLKWELPIANTVITPAEYAAGKAVRTVYGKYINKITSTQTCTFKLELTLTVAQMTFVAGYNQSYWNEGAILSNTNKDKTFLVNPALTSDNIYGIARFFDCQIIASMLKGFNKGTTITSPLDLVSTTAQDASLIFDTDRLNILEGTIWAVESNGKTLTKNGQVAATISADGVIRLNEAPLPTISTHGIPTDAAKALLGKSVPVKLIASYCNGGNGSLEAELDHFLVKFINPLEMTLADVTDSFTDLISGGSKIGINRIATIKEAFGEKRTVWENNSGVTGSLPQWYNVQSVTWNLNAAKTNLKKEGNNIIITNDPMASNWSDFSADYKLSATPSNVNATELKFENNSGAALQQAITISVPVYATAKWTAELTDASKKYVKLTVNPGTTK